MPNWNTAFWSESQGDLGSLAVQAVRGDCHSYGDAAISPASRRMRCKTIPFPEGQGGTSLWLQLRVLEPDARSKANSRSVLRKISQGLQTPASSPLLGLPTSCGTQDPAPRGSFLLGRTVPRGTSWPVSMPESNVLAVNIKFPWRLSLPPPRQLALERIQDKEHCFLDLISLKLPRGFRKWRKVNSLIAWRPAVENERRSASSKLS